MQSTQSEIIRDRTVPGNGNRIDVGYLSIVMALGPSGPAGGTEWCEGVVTQPSGQSQSRLVLTQDGSSANQVMLWRMYGVLCSVLCMYRTPYSSIIHQKIGNSVIFAVRNPPPYGTRTVQVQRVSYLIPPPSEIPTSPISPSPPSPNSPKPSHSILITSPISLHLSPPPSTFQLNQLSSTSISSKNGRCTSSAWGDPAAIRIERSHHEITNWRQCCLWEWQR